MDAELGGSTSLDTIYDRHGPTRRRLTTSWYQYNDILPLTNLHQPPCANGRRASTAEDRMLNT
jgi:hypothetical protein